MLPKNAGPMSCSWMTAVQFSTPGASGSGLRPRSQSKRPIGFAQRAFGCPDRITWQFWRRRAKCEVAGRVSRAVFTLKNGAQMRTVVDTNLRPWRNQFIPGPLNADFFNVRSPDVEEFG